MMDVRRVALAKFGENAIKRDMPMAALEETLVPLYLHHRYQVEAAVSTLGGQHYIYAMRGDGRAPFTRATAAEQRTALRSLMATIAPSALALPEALLQKIPPRPPGYGRSRETFPRWTGSTFDAITPAVTAASHTVDNVLTNDRAARLVEQQALDPSLPGLGDVIDALYAASFGATARTPYEQEVKRAVERVVVDRLMEMAGSAPMPQVRAVATLKLQRRGTELAQVAAANDADGQQQSMAEPALAHAVMLAMDIRKFLERPAPAATPTMQAPAAPPGAPIGDPGMEWLNRVEPPCSWVGSGWR
jgi:hypothetical protein